MVPIESSSPSGKEADVGLDLAKKFHAALGGVPWMAATVPALVDDEGLKWLNSKPAGLTVALHGWDHRMREGDRNEFAGLSMDQCRELISAGQYKIGPTPYTVPPFNAYTLEFVEACRHEGLKYIFGEPKEWPTPPSPFHLPHGVKMVPAWHPLYGATNWEQGGCPSIMDSLHRMLPSPSPAVLTLHITWEAAKDPKFRCVKNLVEKYGSLFVSPDSFISEISKC